MKSNMDVLERLASTIGTQLNNYLPEGIEPIGEVNTDVDFPDIDNMRKNTMFFVQPESEIMESLTLCSDLATMETSIYIMLKKEKHDTMVKKAFHYYNALYLLLRSNQSLDGYVDFIEPYHMEFYPSVTADKGNTAIELTCRVQWAKEW